MSPDTWESIATESARLNERSRRQRGVVLLGSLRRGAVAYYNDRRLKVERQSPGSTAVWVEYTRTKDGKTSTTRRLEYWARGSEVRTKRKD